MSRSLLSQTMELLANRTESLSTIHKSTSLPFHWLRKLSRGEIPNPSVNRIQALYEHLTGAPLLPSPPPPHA